MPDAGEMVTWYRAVLDEKERAAQALDGRRWVADGHDVITNDDDGRYVVEYLGDGVAQHMALHDPASVLADVAVKRTIVDRWQDPDAVEHCWALDADGNRYAYADGRDPDERDRQVAQAREIDWVVRSLVAAQANRPGFKEEWRP